MVERPGSNRRHLAPQASALPTELHPTYFKERERWFSGQSLLQLALLVVVQTPMILTSHLYQVFHITIPQSTLIVIPVGFEPTTSTLEGWRSIQLSYRTNVVICSGSQPPLPLNRSNLRPTLNAA